MGLQRESALLGYMSQVFKKSKDTGDENMRAGSHHTAESRAKMSKALSGVNSPNFGKHLSPEAKEKLAASKRGKPRPPHVIERLREVRRGVAISDEVRAKISAANSGENHPFYGKHLSEEHKKHISESRIKKGCHPTEETRTRMSNAQRGRKHSEETKRKISLSHLGKKQSPEHQAHLAAALKGRVVTSETRRKISLAFKGDKHPNWKGGISYEPYCPKFNADLKQRIRSYFEYHCTMCGKSVEENGKNMCCHHVEYDKSACCDGKPVHFAALCKRCHSKTNNDRGRWEAILHRVIDEIYGGRSYFTKDEWCTMNANEESIDKKISMISGMVPA